MESLVNAFTALLKEFQQRPISFVILFVLIVVTYFGYTQVEYLKQFLPNPEVQSKHFRHTLQRDYVINRALNHTREYLSANTVSITQFHNGSYDLTTIPFTKATRTYFSGDLKKLPVDELYTAHPLSSINKMMVDMWGDINNPQCIGYETKDLEDETFHYIQVALDNKYVSLCPLTNALNYPIGYLTIGFNFVPEPKQREDLKDYQRTLALRIAGYLQEGVVDEIRK